jgi:8-oxo-dGTP pyrophosphatase MutT (NUDIX family)
MDITCGIYLFSVPRRSILACHATRSRWNTWSIPKGLKDRGEDSYRAAIRELYEETGIQLKELTVLLMQALPAVAYKKQKKILEPFLIVTNNDFSSHTFVCHTLVNNQFPEIDKWKWILPDEAGILHETQQENIPLINQLTASYM